MYNNVNVYMLGINPVRIKAANNSSFELVEISSQSTGNGVSITRSGSTSNALEVLYEVVLFDAFGARLDTVNGDAIVAAGQNAIALSTTSMGLPSSSAYAYAEFRLVADGNDYVLAGSANIILQ